MRVIAVQDATTPVQIIPVIDLLHGQVVRAVAGNRDAYRPIESRLTSSCDPLVVLNALLDLTPFATIYVADLDAIANHGSERNRAVLMQLCLELGARGGVELWLDAGNAPWATDLAAAAAPAGVGVSLVSGSESLREYDTTLPECVLSLDYRHGRFRGPTGLDDTPGAWPKRLIVMDLAAVGTAGGPAFARIDALMCRAERSGRTDIAFYAAGGVRDEADLEALAQRHVRGVLVASALHDGRLGVSSFSHFPIATDVFQQRDPGVIVAFGKTE
jgi:phosphoribosylformimino-5-aminoimidazole carboxamide ribotide isomerase